jgi:Flp pilus assembly protein TadD
MQKGEPVLVEMHQDEPIDPILNNAYLAYSGGKFEQAQQLYNEVLRLDGRNIDAILGLAVIAQRRGEDNLAVHYYAQALALDPRNAVANAGMSALSTNDNRESRLKTLLNEQPDSSTLYFALGNRYAEQSRWAEAQQAYFNAYKLESNNAQLAFNLAISLDRLGQKKSAAQYYQRALQLDPGQHAGFDHSQITQRIEALTH